MMEGQRFEFENKVWEIREKLLEGKIKAKDLSFGGERIFTMTELAEALFNDCLSFEIFGKNTIVSDQGRLVNDFKCQDFSELDPEMIQIAKERYFIIKPLVQGNNTVSRVQERIREIKTYHGKLDDGETDFRYYRYRLDSYEKPGLSQQNVYRWIKQYEESNGDIRALIPEYDKCGNPGKSRFPDEVDRIIFDVIKTHYLTKQRKSIRFIRDEVKSRIKGKNKGREKKHALPIPDIGSVRNKINKLDNYLLTRARFGKKIADEQFDEVYTGKDTDIIRPLEVVFIDHTKLDIFLIDEEDGMPIGRPTFTFAMDVATRMPLGFYLGFDAASYRTVAECLFHSIIPKTYLEKLFPDLSGMWPVYGLPETLIVDNGKEFHSRSFKEACLQLGINVQYARPSKGQDKHMIERFFGALNTMFLHELPGTSFSSIVKRKDYNPKENAVLSIQLFEQILHIFLIKGLMRNPRKELGGKTPLDLWRIGVEEAAPSIPHSRNELITLLGAVEYRQVRRTGIQFKEMFYNSTQLGTLRGELKDPTKKVKFKYNPNDLSYIDVYNPVKQKYIRVLNNNQEYSKNLSIWKHNKILAYTRETMEETGYDAFIMAKQIIDDIVQKQWSKEKRTKTRTALGRYGGIEGTVYNMMRGVDEGGAEDVFDIEDEHQIPNQEDNGLGVGDVKVLGFEEKRNKNKGKNKPKNSGESPGRKADRNKHQSPTMVQSVPEDTSPDKDGWGS